MTTAHKTAVILCVGLTDAIITDNTPALKAFRDAGITRDLIPHAPAVTCVSQASILTGKPPAEHGIVANGWFERDSDEIRFWRQSNNLIRAPKIYDTIKRRDPSITTAKMFWWFNMGSAADFSATPRPIDKADGRKIPDCYTHPPELRDQLQHELGRFPLFNFWGPASSIASSQWIANAARITAEQHDPTLTLVYLPHLDYALQRHGPNTPEAKNAAAELDRVAAQLIDSFHARDTRIILCSEYGIEPATTPVHINRVLREEGLLAVREELGTEQLDPVASRAFAVADHQAAHIYVRTKEDIEPVTKALTNTPGIDELLTPEAQRERNLHHRRSGDLLAIAKPHHWFTYDHWLDEARAPDFARTVEIFRKPGYDPRELFIDPRFKIPKLAVARRLLLRKLGFRTPLDVIPLDATLVKGTHGRADTAPEHRPVLITESGSSPAAKRDPIPIEHTHQVILDHLFAAQPA